MQKITYLEKPVYFESYSATGGFEEGRGPLGKNFDFIDNSDLFGMKTCEKAEAEMARINLNIALKKKNLSPSDLNVLVAGDLQNQCVASSGGLFTFGIPFLGLYGACSTCTEGLLVLSAMLSTSKTYTRGASVTSSHNSAAERQFRTPLEYGGQRAPSAQWTATASGAFILGKEKSHIKITAFMPGKAIDGYTKDQSNMGAAMALGAFDSINSFFKENNPDEFDLIMTGDLGHVGSNILEDMLREKITRYGTKLASLHNDCGLLLYDFDTQDVHSGASGCGCSASVLASFILPKIERGELRKILFLSTGALMSTSSVSQGDNILGIAPAIQIEYEE
ncbi:MAG: stage V sporulation protein AD [Clostridia bacterium]|nr:stage V sporulation protein AD [Clostridia bacterium]